MDNNIDSWGHKWITKRYPITGASDQFTNINGKWYRAHSFGYGSFRSAYKALLGKPYRKIFQIHHSGLCTVLIEVTGLED